jgi:hypothetical protein
MLTNEQIHEWVKKNSSEISNNLEEWRQKKLVDSFLVHRHKYSLQSREPFEMPLCLALANNGLKLPPGYIQISGEILIRHISIPHLYGLNEDRSIFCYSAGQAFLRLCQTYKKVKLLIK